MQRAQKLAEGLLGGDRRSLARAITAVENRAEHGPEALARLYPHTGRAALVGITGAPGTGKSTLVNALARALRAQDRTVGVVAVDPTSPFSGGALLGDRVRMSSLTTDPGVFMRSMATRGAFGGLAQATGDVLDLLDAFGAAPLLIETVGVGQSEVEVASLADTTLLVLSPEAGDSVQAMKAGVMEIADVFVVNKADRKGAPRMVQDIQDMLGLAACAMDPDAWHPPVLQCVASRGTGLDEVVDAIVSHRAHQEAAGALQARRIKAAARRIESLVERFVRQRFAAGGGSDQLKALAAEVAARRTSTYAAARKLLDTVLESVTAERGA